MKSVDFKELSDQELLKKIKNLITNRLIGAVLVGLTIGIVIYSAVKNGFGFFTLFPLILTYLIIRNSKNNKILEQELQKLAESRNLK
jgi:hypothetical protein